MNDPHDPLAIPVLGLRTVALDFDGPIHRYSRGIADGTCYDPPVAGALDTIRDLYRVKPVVVMTARPVGPVGEWFDQYAPDIAQYLDPGMHRQWWDELGTILITNRKVVAQHYVDDRAVRFAAPSDASDADATMAWNGIRRAIAYYDGVYIQRHQARAQEALAREAQA